MILPYFTQLTNWRQLPLSLILVFLNLMAFVCLDPMFKESENKLESLVDDEDFLHSQASVFAAMIRTDPDHFAKPLRELASQVDEGTAQDSVMLGRLALRNHQFVSRAADYPFRGDRVLYRHWREHFARYQTLRDILPNYSFGLSSLSRGLEPYLSYQFVHGGLAHLVVNCAVLLLAGCVLEPILGSIFFLVIYLLCGIGAGVGFELLSGATPTPLIGASGSIMGLFGAMLVLGRNRSLRFLWFLPTQSFVGIVMIPVWLVAGYFVITDVTGFIETANWVGTGVAHAAHLSGFATGALLAWIAMRLRPQLLSHRSLELTSEAKTFELRALVKP